MSPRFACADFTFPLLPHDKALALLRLLDFAFVDLGVFEGRSHHYPSTLAEDPKRHADAMVASLRDHRLAASDVFVQTGTEPPIHAANTPDDEIRTRNRRVFDAMLDYARGLGCGHVTGLPGVRHDGVSESDDWRRAVDEENHRVEAAGHAGLTYAVEPHVGSITPDPDAAHRLVDAVPGLTLTLDYGHFVYQGMPNEALHPLIHHASHVHARGGAAGQLQSTVKDSGIDSRR